MTSPRLPGLPTMAALMLAATLVAWLGVSGPISVSYDVVKDFQPLMAAMIALAAGTLAYRGAMAKVEHDRDEARRKRVSDRLALFFRLDAAILDLSVRVGNLVTDIELGGPPNPARSLGKYKFQPSDLRIKQRTEIEEAWQRLDMFPEKAIRDLEFLRRALPQMQMRIEPFAADYPWEVKFPYGLAGDWATRHPDPFLKDYAEACRKIVRACGSVLYELHFEIARTRMQRID